MEFGNGLGPDGMTVVQHCLAFEIAILHHNLCLIPAFKLNSFLAGKEFSFSTSHTFFSPPAMLSVEIAGATFI